MFSFSSHPASVAFLYHLPRPQKHKQSKLRLQPPSATIGILATVQSTRQTNEQKKKPCKNLNLTKKP